MTMTTEKLCELMRIAARGSDDIDGAVETFRALVQEQYSLAERALEPQGKALPETKAWLVDFPDEPELGFYLSEEENKLARSRALVLLDDVRASQLALPAGPVPTDAEFDALRAAAIEACTWLDHANCVNLPVDDDDPDTSMRASMNKLRDLAWKTPRRSASPAVAQPSEDQQAAVAFYAANPSAALFDLNARLSRNQTATPAVAQPVADERDAERLEWVSHAWGGQRHDYANHVLSRGGDGDLSDIRTFIDKHLPARAALCQPAEEGDNA